MLEFELNDEVLFEDNISLYAKNIDINLVHKLNESFKSFLERLELEKSVTGRNIHGTFTRAVFDDNGNNIPVRYDTDGKYLTVSFNNKENIPRETYLKLDNICIADQISRGTEPDGPYGINTWRRFWTI